MLLWDEVSNSNETIQSSRRQLKALQWTATCNVVAHRHQWSDLLQWMAPLPEAASTDSARFDAENYLTKSTLVSNRKRRRARAVVGSEEHLVKHQPLRRTPLAVFRRYIHFLELILRVQSGEAAGWFLSSRIRTFAIEHIFGSPWTCFRRNLRRYYAQA